ncbi:RNA polymerase sigma factor [Thioalkalivibrio paradoxus]|uniref:RNA polymerase subunit sigma-24 n=1 Tax=Thioalkalivibrio paradoxus ARh 1 TaxID=713585 RepID=W0DR78_9GAMM|nr:sigma-70 family RNA polymerase sigma factor [Thioalkalivibrio paradoxus]AHE99498.1 RNA polymerase subunit sigma-24 [Thioalkalivibrio paradoxus ARh 1]
MAAWLRQRRLRQQVCDLRPQLYRTAFAWCHDAALADDLVQEAMIKALTGLKTLQDEAALKAWVFRIMTNCYRDWGRRQRDTVDVDDLELPCDDACPETHTERGRVVLDVRRAMARLSDDHRQVISLVDIEGFAYAEVSEVLGVPIGTVMSRLSRARGQLRKLLQEQAGQQSPALRLIRNTNE